MPEHRTDEDRRRREEADARNSADTLLYQTDKLVRDNGEQIGPDIKARLEDAQGKVRTALEGSDVESLKTATDELIRVSQEAGQAIYAASSAEQAGQQTTGDFTGGQAQGDDDIVDAEVVDDGDDDRRGTA